MTVKEVIEKIKKESGASIPDGQTCDILISAMAMVRYVERSEGIPAGNRVEEFVDEQYPDGMIEWTWPNLRIE